VVYFGSTRPSQEFETSSESISLFERQMSVYAGPSNGKDTRLPLEAFAEAFVLDILNAPGVGNAQETFCVISKDIGK